jgi:hypothetical protein
LWPERIKGRRWGPKTAAAGRQEKDPYSAQAARSRRPTDWAMESNLRRLLQIVSGLAENTNSIFCDGPGARDNEWMSGSATGTTLRGTDASCRPGSRYFARPQGRARRIASSLDKRLTWTSVAPARRCRTARVRRRTPFGATASAHPVRSEFQTVCARVDNAQFCLIDVQCENSCSFYDPSNSQRFCGVMTLHRSIRGPSQFQEAC